MIRVHDEGGLEGGLRLVVLDRADKANALTAAMLADLAAAVETAEGFAALVVTGAGKVFSAGADLQGMAEGLGDAPEWGRLTAALDGFRGLSVAALNGTLAGGAFGMALACDLRVCVPGAEFFYPVMKRGYLPQPSDPKRLAALVGPSRARMILLAGARIGAAEALGWGLVDRVADDALAAARALCADALAAGAHGARIKALF
ncbi:enoyl-CoA hydratase/isomerase family protein [Paragemmobacter straminiformis]|uniref:enoyl-CoA hydratase/isomerase family protein n=1 Tax=Paragemmobacter straminiformis TaxID=2045119 RepID=UPI0030CA2F60